jgi:hypothetical protein
VAHKERCRLGSSAHRSGFGGNALLNRFACEKNHKFELARFLAAR